MQRGGLTPRDIEAAMSHVLHRSPGAAPPAAVSGRGLELFDADGRAYLDASGGAAVSCLGHGHPEVLQAMRRQLDSLAYAHTSFFTSEPAEALAEELIAHAPGGLSHVYYACGGSEAVEAALKLARQYFVETGRPGRRRFIARRLSYHGVTLGALSVGGHAARQAPFEPILMEGHLVSPCFDYRGRGPDETPGAYGLRLARELESEILRLGAETVAAFVAETVVGAAAGAVPPAPGYLRAVREVCDRHGVLLILDEVMCGMGRTGTLHACEQEGVAPDLMTIAKGLGGGYAPIGAVLVSSEVVRALRAGSGAFVHGQTYNGHPVSCAAALAVQRVIRRDGLLDNVRAQGERLARRLHERFGEHPFVGDIRGRGLLQAIELVADRGARAPFPAPLRLGARIKQEAMARGLLVYPGAGCADGRAGDHVLIAPPFIVDAAAVDLIVERLAGAVEAALEPVLAEGRHVPAA
jgi:adenosylmethionine-8-amino-7-oxononanoate aminotransferase